jgi:outer membrane biosynthesis protein TonB
MPELLIPIFIFFLIYNYHTMKKSKNTTEKPTTKAQTEKPAAIVATETIPKAISPTKMPPSKPKAITPKPKAIKQTEQPITAAVTQGKPKKPSPTPKSPGKAKDVAPKTAVSTTEITVSERVGLTAGDIWHYLDKQGATTVAKLVRDLPEEEKVIQRSIGWLAQEGKITLDTIDRVETISLAG